ncbi:hypothetical protein FB451DRAFT_1565710 [Mycena latifolia]|nr:hypothetical protein FB451DRAFT_1565710 [Mycena latifolia]
MLFNARSLFHLIALALSLGPALAWEVMLYENGATRCNGGGTTISGGEVSTCHPLVPGATYSMSVVTNDEGAEWEIYEGNNCDGAGTTYVILGSCLEQKFNSFKNV